MVSAPDLLTAARRARQARAFVQAEAEPTWPSGRQLGAHYLGNIRYDFDREGAGGLELMVRRPGYA